MKKILLVLPILLTTQMIGCSSAKTISTIKPKITSHNISHQVEEIINNTDPNVNIGIKIISLTDNKVLYERNADRHFVPASTIKLATIAAALYYLGPYYRFDTSIFTDGFDHGSSSVRNIYLQGSGDPSLMDHDLINLSLELKQLGITSIHGNLYIDDQVFDDILWTRGAMWDDRDRGYAAPVCGLNINYNRLQVKTVPAHKPNLLAHALVKPATKYIQVTSRARTKGDTTSRNLSISVEHEHQEKPWPNGTSEGLSAGDHIYINGQIPQDGQPSYSMLSVKDPAMLAGTFLKEQLHRLGIQFTGTIIRQKTPAEALKLVTHQSRALSEAIIDFTKISNNIANDSLVKAIAVQAGLRPASFASGLKLIGDFLAKEVGIATGSMINADGAGVSRYNLATPDQMLKILSYAANHFNLGPEFMAAMPLAGQDGLLSSRLKAPHLAGNIRAKTGTLTGASSLVGYYLGNEGQRYAFAIMINGFVGSVSKYTKLQDDILASLLEDKEAQIARAK